MIVAKIYGGLGNQMFQYAFSKSLAIQNKTDLYLDLSWYSLDKSSTHRKFQLDVFNTEFKIANSKIISDSKPLLLSLLNAILVRLKLGRLQTSNYFVEDKFCYNSSVDKIGNVCYVNGYWQSHKYFHEIKEVIQSDFKLKKIFLNELNASYLENIINNNSVGIHIRRSDYTLNNNKSIHGTLSIDYYMEAIRIMESKLNSPIFFIFSDDIGWARNKFKNLSNCKFVSSSHDYLDLFLISQCKHNIIANSSFSWWGAWLNSNPEKIIIAPKKWFSCENLNKQTNDLIPETWVRL
jgi:hypothetical protein